MLLELFSGNMQHVALYQGATDGVGALVAFALVPWIGSYSDTHGRRPALLISALSAAAPVFVLAAYPYLIGTQMTSVLIHEHTPHAALDLNNLSLSKRSVLCVFKQFDSVCRRGFGFEVEFVFGGLVVRG